MYAHGVGGTVPHVARKPLARRAGGDLGQSLEQILNRIPGHNPQSVSGALGAMATKEGQAWNPLNVAGVGSNHDMFAPVVAGRQLGDVVEGTNRGSLYLVAASRGTRRRWRRSRSSGATSITLPAPARR